MYYYLVAGESINMDDCREVVSCVKRPKLLWTILSPVRVVVSTFVSVFITVHDGVKMCYRLGGGKRGFKCGVNFAKKTAKCLHKNYKMLRRAVWESDEEWN